MEEIIMYSRITFLCVVALFGILVWALSSTSIVPGIVFILFVGLFVFNLDKVMDWFDKYKEI